MLHLQMHRQISRPLHAMPCDIDGFQNSAEKEKGSSNTIRTSQRIFCLDIDMCDYKYMSLAALKPRPETGKQCNKLYNESIWRLPCPKVLSKLPVACSEFVNSFSFDLHILTMPPQSLNTCGDAPEAVWDGPNNCRPACTSESPRTCKSMMRAHPSSSSCKTFKCGCRQVVCPLTSLFGCSNVQLAE